MKEKSEKNSTIPDEKWTEVYKLENYELNMK
jgi:hypothetical protein